MYEAADTHLDSLTERLREPRVRRVIEPLLAGGFPDEEIPEDDLRFVEDLGLVAMDAGACRSPTRSIARSSHGRSPR